MSFKDDVREMVQDCIAEFGDATGDEPVRITIARGVAGAINRQTMTRETEDYQTDPMPAIRTKIAQSRSASGMEETHYLVEDTALLEGLGPDPNKVEGIRITEVGASFSRKVVRCESEAAGTAWRFVCRMDRSPGA